MYVLLVTMAVYPGLAMNTTLTLLTNVRNSTNWYNILVQIIFNFFDTIGRYAGGMKSLDLKI